MAATAGAMPEEAKNQARAALSTLFGDPWESSVFIPAGRSLITLLASQLNYIYSTMEDAQKRAIDFCTRVYLETILKIRPEFEGGLERLLDKYPMKAQAGRKNLESARDLMRRILKGSYAYKDGEERLELADSR